MRRLPATTVYYGLELLLRVPTWVVMAVYLVRELHLSPLQLVLMGTAMEAAVFLFEVPTGVVADTYSRRLSLIAGFLGHRGQLDEDLNRLGGPNQIYLAGVQDRFQFIRAAPDPERHEQVQLLLLMPAAFSSPILSRHAGLTLAMGATLAGYTSVGQ